MSVSIGDIIRITCNFRLGAADFYVNTYNCQWFGIDGVNDELAMQQIASDFNFAYGMLVSKLSDTLFFETIQGQNITKSILLPTESWPTLTSGASAGHLLPPQVAGYIFYRTTRPKTRAANYIPGLTEDDNSASGSVASGLIDDLQAFGDFAVTGFAEVVQHLIYGAYNRPLDRFTPVNAAIVANQWRTQRRRGRGIEL